ncbi:MAG: DUF308 domain-containing protein [Spirochaetaceae bacterium]|nr:DUF308 domain-containing protein [Spirochaetaceae bacterium]
MKTGFMKKNLLLTMIFAILLVVLGVFIMIQGQNFLKIVLILFGVVAIINGIKEFILVSRFSEFRATRFTGIISAVSSIAIGVIILVYPYFSQKIAITIVLYLFAAQLIISSLSRLISSFTIKKNNLEGFSLSLIPVAFNITVAFIFILFPTQVTEFFLKVVGVLFVLYGLGLFFWGFKMRSVEKQVQKEDIEGDAVIVD